MPLVRVCTTERIKEPTDNTYDICSKTPRATICINDTHSKLGPDLFIIELGEGFPRKMVTYGLDDRPGKVIRISPNEARHRNATQCKRNHIERRRRAQRRGVHGNYYYWYRIARRDRVRQILVA